jgi:hypothetical protein
MSASQRSSKKATRGKHGNHARGPSHYRWNGGRTVNKDGYVKVFMGVGHPLADPIGYAYEHHVVFGRRPRKGYIIHHKDEVRHHNSRSNLEEVRRGTHNAMHLATRGRGADGRFLPKVPT